MAESNDEAFFSGDVRALSFPALWLPWLLVTGQLAAEEAMPGLPVWEKLVEPADEGVAVVDGRGWAKGFARLFVTGGFTPNLKPTNLPMWE